MMCSIFALYTNTVEAKTDSSLKVCASENEMPYSNKNKEGFENKIAELVASKLDRNIEYVWTDKAAIFLVTELLLKNKCDVVVGVDKSDPRVATSNPYYKSGYAFIYKKENDLSIKSWSSEDIEKVHKIAVTPGSPAEVMMRESGKYEDNFNYLKSLIGFKSIRNKYQRYEPSMLVNEVTSGNADMAVLWAPEAARYVKASPIPLEMNVGPAIEKSKIGEEIEQHYEQAFAVRENDTVLLKEINFALKESKEEIKNILQSEGVPLL